MKLNLLVLKTNKLHDLANFYANFGLHFEYHQHGQGVFHYASEINGLVFEIYPLPKHIAEPDSSTRLGFEAPDLDGLLERLIAKNVNIVSMPRASDYGYVAVVEDLDGRKIEILDKSFV